MGVYGIVQKMLCWCKLHGKTLANPGKERVQDD